MSDLSSSAENSVILVLFPEVYIEGQKYAGYSGTENCFTKEKESSKLIQ